MTILARAKLWAKTIKRDIAALWLAARDPRTPRLAKLLSLALLTYALSPIDLIPDFIPVLGLLDDIILLPLGIVLLLRMIPADLMHEFRERAAQLDRLPSSRAGLMLVLAIWAAAGLALALWIIHNWP